MPSGQAYALQKREALFDTAQMILFEAIFTNGKCEAKKGFSFVKIHTVLSETVGNTVGRTTASKMAGRS